MRKATFSTFILFGFHSAFTATHSLRYVHTATLGIPEFPAFMAVSLVDEEQIDYYDSNIRRDVPRVEWMAKSMDTSYWEHETQIRISAEQHFKNNIVVAKKRFNQTGGVHTNQWMYGCEWDDETGVTDGYNRDAYDGEDFIVFDMKNMRHIAPVPQAVPTQQKWDKDRAFIEQRKNYLTQECIVWLKKYVDYGRDTLNRKARPEVSLLQKDSSSSVSCHATGFFPKSIMINWQKDGREMHEDVETTEVLPNGDGTFQIRSILRVSPEDMKNHEFSCVVDHVSLEEKMVKKWAPGINLLPIIIACVAVLLVVAAGAGFLVWKNIRQDYRPASASDSGSDNSSQQAGPV